MKAFFRPDGREQGPMAMNGKKLPIVRHIAALCQMNLYEKSSLRNANIEALRKIEKRLMMIEHSPNGQASSAPGRLKTDRGQSLLLKGAS